MKGSWTEDTAAIFLGFIIITLALAAFLIAPFASTNEALITSAAQTGFSLESWIGENESGSALTELMSDSVNSARPARWTLNPLSAFSLDFLISAIVFFIFLGILFGCCCDRQLPLAVIIQ